MTIHFKRPTRPSAQILARRLRSQGYSGRSLNFGYGIDTASLNSPEAIANASNKRKALELMGEAGVPIPTQVSHPTNGDYPLVARTERHRKGRGFWLVHNDQERDRARRLGATHFMEYIEGAREFRVHVVNGKSIKLSEKIGGGITRNRGSGAICQYPDFNHKKTLRKVGRQAVEALGLDFGAVDVLYKDGKFYVLEVNTAPCLTDEQSDTLERYARAFMEEYHEPNHTNDSARNGLRVS